MASTSSQLQSPSTTENTVIRHEELMMPARMRQTRARLEQIFNTIPSLPAAFMVAEGGRATMKVERALEEGSTRMFLCLHNSPSPTYILKSIHFAF